MHCGASGRHDLDHVCFPLRRSTPNGWTRGRRGIGPVSVPLRRRSNSAVCGALWRRSSRPASGARRSARAAAGRARKHCRRGLALFAALSLRCDCSFASLHEDAPDADDPRSIPSGPAFAEAWASHLAREVQAARFRSEVIAMRTVAARLDAWLDWNRGAVPPKGKWKQIAESGRGDAGGALSGACSPKEISGAPRVGLELL